MIIYLSYSSKDGELGDKLYDKLKHNGQDVFSAYTVTSATRMRKQIEADVYIFLVTKNFSDDPLTHNDMMAALPLEGMENLEKLVLPVVFSGAALPTELQSYLYLAAEISNPDETNDIDDLCIQVLQALEKIKLNKEQKKATAIEVNAKLEKDFSDFLTPAKEKLRNNEKQNKKLAYACYCMAALILILSISISIFKTCKIFSFDSWQQSIAELSGLALILALLISLSRLSFTMGKSFMVESIRNSDRLHAISFGESFLKAYGNDASREEIREVFSDWNIDSGAAFPTQSSQEYDPQINLASILSTIKKQP